MRNGEQSHDLEHERFEKFDGLGRGQLVVLFGIFYRDHLHLAILFVLRKIVSAQLDQKRQNDGDAVALACSCLLS
jgi:hypothetical protein